MRALCCWFWICLTWYLLMEIQNTGANGNQCPFSASIHDFKKHFAAIKDFLDSKDTVTEVSLLKPHVLNQIKASERCCFLLKLGRFYLTNVFPGLQTSFRNMDRSISHLANSMLCMKIELKHCYSTMRCPCGEQSHSIMEEFKENFYKLDTDAATVKAFGDLNILYHWMRKNFPG